jgi:tetratricopeptide (TPR) repeat protein
MGFAHRRLESDKQLVVYYYEKAVQILLNIFDKNKIDWCLMATVLNNLVAAQPHGDLDLALERERLVLDIRLKHLPLSHPLVATTHTTLSEIYLSRGEFEEAIVHSNEALRIKLTYLPSGHPSIATTYSSMGLLYLYKGDYEITKDQKEMSEKSYKKSLELNYQAFDVLSSGGSSSSTHYALISFLYNNCGVVYTRLGRLDEALDCFNIVTNTTLPHLPDNHDLHGASLKNKGKIFTLQGNMSKGMEYYNLALEFYKRIGLSNSLRMAQIYFNIGEWYEVSGTKDLAIEYYERAVQIGAENHQPNHPFLLQYMKALEKMKSKMITNVPIEEATRL